MAKATAQYTIRDENDITIGAVAPASPILNELWLNTSVTPSVLMRWNGTKWEKCNDYDSSIDELGKRITSEITKANDAIVLRVLSSELKTKVDTIIDGTLVDGVAMKTIISNANKNANSALTNIQDMSLDGKVSPQEKKSLHAEHALITTEHAQIVANATAYVLVSTAYVNAYNAWTTLVGPLVADGNRETTSTINRTDFVTKSTTLYRERQALLNAISEKIKQLGNEYADGVGTSVESSVTDKLMAEITTTEGRISARVEEIETVKNDFGEFISGKFADTVTTVDGITSQVGSVQTRVEEVDGKLVSYQELVATYMQFTEAGLAIGKTNSKFRALLDNEQLAFMQDNEIVSYISNSKMYITKAEITEQLTIGNPTKGYFDWVLRDSGNLGLQWRRG